MSSKALRSNENVLLFSAFLMDLGESCQRGFRYENICFTAINAYAVVPIYLKNTGEINLLPDIILQKAGIKVQKLPISFAA